MKRVVALLALALLALTVPPGIASEHPTAIANARIAAQCPEWRYGTDYALNCATDTRLIFTASTWFVRACAGSSGGVVEWAGFDGAIPRTGSEAIGPGECIGDGDGRQPPLAGCVFARVTFTPFDGSPPVTAQSVDCATALL